MLYFGLYDATARKLDGPLLIAPDDAAASLSQDAHLAVGNGAARLAEAAAARGLTVSPSFETLQPNAGALAEIAHESGETCDVLRPLYLRPPDAQPFKMPTRCPVCGTELVRCLNVDLTTFRRVVTQLLWVWRCVRHGLS